MLDSIHTATTCSSSLGQTTLWMKESSVRFLTIALAAPILYALPASGQDFAPDNKQIAVPWGGQIQTINIETRAFMILPKSDDGVRAVWSPSGRYILFMTGHGETSIRLYDSKTGDTRILGGNLTFPVAWREDSGRLAMFHVPATGKSELIEYSVGEKGIAQRTDIAYVPNANAPMVWLPTTDNVAYLGTDGNIYTVEEGEIHKITTSNDVIGMALSRTGKSLIWARRGPNLKYILTSFYLYNLKSRSVKRLEFPGQVPGINPDPRHAPTTIETVVFSSDGTHAAIQVTTEQAATKTTAAARTPQLFTVRLDGAGAKQAAVGAGVTPFWSRDGKLLAVLQNAPVGGHLTVMNPDGGEQTRLLGAAH